MTAIKRNLPPMPSSKPPPIPTEHLTTHIELNTNSLLNNIIVDSSSLPNRNVNKSSVVKPKSLNINGKVRKGSISSFTKCNSNVYIAEKGCVRSTRLTELKVKHIINLNFEETQDVYHCDDVSISNYYVGDNCSDNQIELLHKVVDDLESMKPEVCVIQSQDMNLAGIVIVAHMIKYQDCQCLEESIKEFKLKRPDFSLDFYFHNLLEDYENSLKAPKGKFHSLFEWMTKIITILIQNWFIVGLFLIVILVVANLINKS